MTRSDAIVVGGGPAGLAAAIALAQRGCHATVLERQRDTPDKACGEGLLPPALRALAALGVRDLLDPAEAAPIEGIRYLEADGRVAEGRLPAPGGLAVRRTALVDALERRARALGVELRHGVRAIDHRVERDRVVVELGDGAALDAALLVGADGLHSAVRARAGLDTPARGPRRFGLRQHFAARAPDRFVEVHFADGVEAYVAASGADRVGVTFLWEDGRVPVAPTVPSLLALFPRLAARLAGATPLSRPRGAGPMACRARAAVADRLVLVGDAAGYVDAITGEGLSVAFGAALALGALAPRAFAGDATPGALAPYQRDLDRIFRRYAAVTRTVLALARHAALRRAALRALGAWPTAFDRVIAWTVC